MIASTSHQDWLFYFPLAQQAALLKDDLLDPVDQLLEDPALVDLVRQCLATRSPLSQRTGRTGIAPDRLLRCCVMKHLKGWSFRDLERELRSNLVYRRFTHFDAEATPDSTTFSRTFALLSPAVTEQIHQRVVRLACEQGVAQGQKLRTDRAVKHRLLEISRAAKCLTQANQQRMRDSYQKLLALTRGVVLQAGEVIGRWGKKRLKVVGQWLQVGTQIGQLRHFLPLVEKVIRQTKKRVLGGDNNVEGKVLSLFETHTEVIRKGKAHKPSEFGRLVRIDEVENGIVSGYQILTGNPADTTAWVPALQHHQVCFGRAPELPTGDPGWFSSKSEQEAHALGVKKVALPVRGRLSAKRAEQQKQRWFRRSLRWRAGCEATISPLKHPFSMRRATYKGDRGFQRYVGWCVITKNLFSVARHQQRRKDQ